VSKRDSRSVGTSAMAWRWATGRGLFMHARGEAPSANTPPTVQTFYGEYSITLVKDSERAQLGLRVGHGPRDPRGRLVINGITEDGLISTWNQEHADSYLQVMVDDLIVGVNDVDDGQTAMMDECAWAQTLVVRLVRLTLEERRAMRHDDFHDKETASRSVFERLPTIYAGASGMSECIVCQEDFDPQQLLTQLPCKHAFCTPCISRWLLECKNECPLCAGPITQETVPEETTLVDEDTAFVEMDFDLANSAETEFHHGGSPKRNRQRFSVSRRDGFGPRCRRGSPRKRRQAVRTARHI